MCKRTLRKGAVLAFPILLMAGLVGCQAGDEAASASQQQQRDTTAAFALKAQNTGATAPAQRSMPSSDESQTAASASHGGSLASLKTPVVQERQVIRHAELQVRVTSVEKAEKSVSEMVRAAGGYTESESSTDLASISPSLTLSLRVPVGEFDASISRFESLGVRLSKKIDSQDVTSQLIDLDARLKTLRAQEEVYQSMLKGMRRLDDVYSIQDQLTLVRTQIESIDGQRKSQAGLAALSTISLTLQENAVANKSTTDPDWLGQTWGEATSGASAALRIVIVALVWILAFSPFWLPALLILRRAFRPAFHRPAAAPPLEI